MAVAVDSTAEVAVASTAVAADTAAADIANRYSQLDAKGLLLLKQAFSFV
jgi:hypothetical protein